MARRQRAVLNDARARPFPIESLSASEKALGYRGRRERSTISDAEIS